MCGIDMFQDLYANKRVFVTGNTGFKGSWLTFWLKKLGADVLGYSLESKSNPNHFELLQENTPTIYGNILDFESLEKAVKEHKPEIVFHLAAQPLVQVSYAQPTHTFETNVMGTVNIFEAIRKCDSVGAVINVTTDKVYENKERSKPYEEDEKLGGYDPYSASKACSEIVTASYRRSFFHPSEYGKTHHTLIATARSGNVIGGGDWAVDRLIPDIMRATVAGKRAEIRNPEATRPWQHVLEPLSGYLLLGSELLKGNTLAATAWNFGPETARELSVKDVLLSCQNHWEKIRFVFKETSLNHEAGKLQLDSSKALRELQWKNTWDQTTSIKKTVDWYRAYYEQNKILTKEQFSEYLETASKKGLSWLQ